MPMHQTESILTDDTFYSYPREQNAVSGGRPDLAYKNLTVAGTAPDFHWFRHYALPSGAKGTLNKLFKDGQSVTKSL